VIVTISPEVALIVLVEKFPLPGLALPELTVML
jgi:hypothetical protein